MPRTPARDAQVTDSSKRRRRLRWFGLFSAECEAFQILAGILNLGNCDFYNQEEEDRVALCGSLRDRFFSGKNNLPSKFSGVESRISRSRVELASRRGK